MKIINVCGARPNFMKIAPLMAAYRRRPDIQPLLVHTGQHYDAAMSERFFDDLGIPRPDVNLGVGVGSPTWQTAQIMLRFEPVVAEHRPDLVLVVGDVSSTVACALAAARMGVRVAHVEAGLRSFDRTMPEEINRLLTDALSDLLFVTEPSGLANLAREGADPAKVHFVGNVMIDSLLANLERARNRPILADLGLVPRGYGVLTLHRPSNVDDPATLGRLLEALGEIARELPILFPVHPRTRRNLEKFGLADAGAGRGLRLVDPLGYLDFLRLMAGARLVLTDSGGIQEETTILKVPCLTLRENTERPVTVDVGCNQLVGADPARIAAAFRRIMAAPELACRTPDLWDGRAAERIVALL